MVEPMKLPIKVVPALKEDFYNPFEATSGGGHKIFEEPTREFRERLAHQVIEVRDHFQAAFRTYPGVPGVAKVRVRVDAIAKSHRPTRVLSEDTCPIIGCDALGALLLSVTPSGLEKLARTIERDETQQGRANLSTLTEVGPLAPEIQPGLSSVVPVKIKLFRHGTLAANAAVDRAFADVLRRHSQTRTREVRYTPKMKVFRLDDLEEDALAELCAFIGTQSLGSFPIYLPVRTAATPVRNVLPEDFPPPDPEADYPTVGMIDAGTTPDDPQLSPWVVARESDVPPDFQDNTHGNFVAGLIAQGKRLNHDDYRFPGCSARIVDVVALPKDGASEDDLLESIENALRRHPEVIVWNLSLGTEIPISDHAFSDFGVALDRLQDDYGKLFILAAGNYRQPPFRGWPPEAHLSGADRICSPADSVRSIVVGSLAHRDHASARVRAGEPSPFSRRGPGPLYLPMPEISHLGGNCGPTGNCSQVGILSLDGQGHVAEDIGTSFAAPHISNLAGNVSHRIIGGATRTLTRALVLHSTALYGKTVNAELFQHQGFGVPPDIDRLLGCEPWQCTLVFEMLLRPDLAFQKADFPMPDCLHMGNGVLRANLLMTLVYDPALDPSFGAEYCRSNVEISLGTHPLGQDGKRHQKKQVPREPQLRGGAYEKDLVEHGFKWSPIKVYRREMVQGVQGDRWRLNVSVQHRSAHVASEEQYAVLIVTLADPEKRADVYNEMVVLMNRAGWAAVDLQIRQRIRQ